MEHEIQIAQSMLYVGALAALAFAMITGMLYTLAMQMSRAIRIHNLVRETKIMRMEYFQKHKQQEAAR